MRELTDQLEALGLRRLGPEPVGPAHRHRSLWAGPPGFVDVVGRPHDQGCDFRRVPDCDEGLTAHKTRRLTLGITATLGPKTYDLFLLTLRSAAGTASRVG